MVVVSSRFSTGSVGDQRVSPDKMDIGDRSRGTFAMTAGSVMSIRCRAQGGVERELNHAIEKHS